VLLQPQKQLLVQLLQLGFLDLRPLNPLPQARGFLDNLKRHLQDCSEASLLLLEHLVLLPEACLRSQSQVLLV
jgi:hypothetical protein